MSAAGRDSMDEKKKRRSSIQAATIGLIGTVLTVCGGLTGALIGGATTIYKTNQQAQHIAIAAPDSSQPLQVNTRQIAISKTEAAKLDGSKYLVFPELGFVIAQPPSNWKNSGQITYLDLFLEEGKSLSPTILFSSVVQDAWNDQPAVQLQYGTPVTVKFVDGSKENGIAVDTSKMIYNPVAFTSQVTILALDKTVAQENYTLYGLALGWGSLHAGGVNDLVANPDSQYVFEQVSWKLEHVLVNDQQTDLTLQRWGLFAEGPDRYYIVEVQYVPAEGQPSQVWDDLQAFLNGFRVIH
jgi:hypothetical protein